VAFVCPELVTHYMNAHGYRPPEEFCRAMLACPPMRSMPYLKALLAGARPLVQAVGGEAGADCAWFKRRLIEKERL
jgi:hypothetical protein